MRPRLCALASLAFAFVLHGPARAEPAADPIEGKWWGSAGFPTDRVELGLEFRRNEKGEWCGDWPVVAVNDMRCRAVR